MTKPLLSNIHMQSSAERCFRRITTPESAHSVFHAKRTHREAVKEESDASNQDDNPLVRLSINRFVDLAYSNMAVLCEIVSTDDSCSTSSTCGIHVRDRNLWPDQLRTDGHANEPSRIDPSLPRSCVSPNTKILRGAESEGPGRPIESSSKRRARLQGCR